MSNSTPIAVPIIIAEIRRSGRETVRVALDEFKGHRIVDARIWFMAEDGTPRPGKGLTLGLRLLPELAEGIGKALVEARRLGLLDAGGGDDA